MDFVALAEEEFGEVGAVLARDTGDKRALFHVWDELEGERFKRKAFSQRR
jgi:hypothetical protein